MSAYPAPSLAYVERDCYTIRAGDTVLWRRDWFDEDSPLIPHLVIHAVNRPGQGPMLSLSTDLENGHHPSTINPINAWRNTLPTLRPVHVRGRLAWGEGCLTCNSSYCDLED